MRTTGLLVMAYGTPPTPDDVEAYYTHIRRGRPPREDQLADLRRRYDAIGGISPLRRITEAQAAGLAAALGDDVVVELGLKHAAPFIEDGAAALRDAGVERIVGLVLAPHYSAGSVGQYHDRAATTLGDAADYRAIDRWWDLPEWISFQAAALERARAGLPDDTHVLFTAHSLPERVLDGDPYPDELFASARAVGSAAGLSAWGDWGLGWQSAGATPEPWRGPDVLQILTDLAGTGRSAGVVVCPQGFVADHLEVLFDLDIEARTQAEDLGLAFARTDSINDDPEVMAALARLVTDVAA